MTQISRKTAEVAELPHGYLQMFAGEEEGYPSLEDTPEFRDDAREFNAKMDKFVADRAPKEEPKEENPETPVETKVENEPEQDSDKAEKPEVAEPEQKPKQDSETNKAFQEMRKAREEAERIAKEAEERSKRADALIAQQWGHLGITTVEQYEAAVKDEQEAEANKRYEESGLTKEEIEKIRKYDELEKTTNEQQQQQKQAEIRAGWDELYKAYPELVDQSRGFDTGEEVPFYNDAMQRELARGASPLAAYRSAHFETILAKKLGETKEVAKQEALNNLNSKNHLKPSGAESADVDHVEIDDQTMRMYRALNKGKSDAEIRKWHKKHAMGG